MEATAHHTTTLTAGDVMTTDVIPVPADMPLEDLAGFLTSQGISGAPVTNEDGELIGVVSLTDIARYDGLPAERRGQSNGRHDVYQHFRLETLESEYDREELEGFHVEGGSGVTVRDIMTPVVFGVMEHVPIQDVADYMIRGRIHRQFVTRDRKVVGVISAMDLLKVVRDLPK
jgi:CBS domain-containing protein